MNEKNIVIRHRVGTPVSIRDFAHNRGVCAEGVKEVLFLRAVGVNAGYQKTVQEMDRELSNKMKTEAMRYCRFTRFPGSVPVEEIGYYTACYEEWKNSGRRVLAVKATQGGGLPEELAGNACDAVCKLYGRLSDHVNPSIEKNFAVKLLFWLDQVCSVCLKDWDYKECVKLVFSDVIKKQEYLFCYMLTLSGCDVLLLESSQDIDDKLEQLHLSEKIRIGPMQRCVLPEYVSAEGAAQPAHGVVNVRRPDRDSRTNAWRLLCASEHAGQDVSASGSLGQPAPAEEITRRQNISQNTRSGMQEELGFEELARLASSVVMITIHDADGQTIGTGSGIMIGREGYILTNNHVTSGGRSYSVRIEDDEIIYRTDELIKYNSVLDLAVIRIRRKLIPIPVYSGTKKLARGQKVVAIGSPLGMFNSVSDGIISGFRNIDQVDMIQFTAPTSHGSSGGALLNMYGEVIGISTAGVENAQNINLAVGYESIRMFIKGFT